MLIFHACESNGMVIGNIKQKSQPSTAELKPACLPSVRNHPNGENGSAHRGAEISDMNPRAWTVGAPSKEVVSHASHRVAGMVERAAVRRVELEPDWRRSICSAGLRAGRGSTIVGTESIGRPLRPPEKGALLSP